MLEFLLKTADEAGVESIFLEVRVTNLPAIRLYKSVGFMEIGIRKGYYPGIPSREDALILVRRNPPPAQSAFSATTEVNR